MTDIDEFELEAHGLARLTGSQLAAGATSPVAATETGSVVLPDGTEMMRSASGNIGFGVTPSAWAGGGNLQIAAGGMVAASSSYSSYGANFYYGSGAYRYIADGPATMERHDNGAINWQVAPSGTVGDPISFTEAMKLDPGGNLLVGTTSAVNGSKATISSTSGTARVAIQSQFGSGGDATLYLECAGVNSGEIRYSRSAAHIEFINGGVKALNIDTSGNLLVGTTNNIWGARSVHVTSGSQPALVAANPDTASPSNILLWCHAAGLDRLIVYGNGNVLNSNNSYGGFSDAKLKENITDVSPKLAKLMQVRIVNYNLKSDPDKTKLLGVVAQELEQVIPGMVEETADRDAEGNDLGTTTKSVKYSVFVPMLIKGMQEQQAQIEALTARLSALEAAQAV